MEVAETVPPISLFLVDEATDSAVPTLLVGVFLPLSAKVLVGSFHFGNAMRERLSCWKRSLSRHLTRN